MVFFSKIKLWRLVADKIGRHRISPIHIFSVLNILIQEIVAELKSDKEVSVGNFGSFRISSLKQKKVVSVNTGKIKPGKAVNAVRFKLTRRLSKFLSDKSIQKLKSVVK